MSRPTVTLRQVDENGLQYVEALLEENDLPSRDVRSKPDCFYVGYDGEDPVGIGGIEIHGSDGLLRSVVVERAARGNGVGTALCDALETEARAEGVGTLSLLTTTASEFFAARGYLGAERSDVPATIRETTEFADLCPTTADCLMKSL